MVSRTAAANKTPVDVRTGKLVIKSIKVVQRTSDAPVLYLQVMDKHDGVCGTDKPAHVLQVPAGVANPTGTATQMYHKETFYGNFGGLYLGTGLAYGVTTAPDNNTDPDAGDEPEVIINYENIG